MNICNSCIYQFDKRHCNIPNFGEVVRCNSYVDKKYFYKNYLRRTSYFISYNFFLNTSRGFRIIYFLMKLMPACLTAIISLITVVIS